VASGGLLGAHEVASPRQLQDKQSDGIYYKDDEDAAGAQVQQHFRLCVLFCVEKVLAGVACQLVHAFS